MSTSTITLEQLRLQARYKADMVQSNFCDDTELNTYINASAYELYDLLVTAYGEDYYNTESYQFTTTVSAQAYDLPSNFFKLAGVDCNISGTGSANTPITLKPFKFNERNKFSYQNVQMYRGTNLRYRLKGDQIYFNLFPQPGQTITIWYVPQMTVMVDDDDTLDGVSGWQEYVLVDAAIKMLQKQDLDVTILAAQKMALIKRINDTAANRDQGQAECVSDVSDYNNGVDGYGNSGTGFGGMY